MINLTKDEVIKLLDTMRLLSPETVWKSQDECRGYLKAIDEIKLVLKDIQEVEG